jgi:Glycosyltransferase family 87
MKYRPRDIMLALFPLLLSVELLTAAKFLPEAMRGNADTRQFYVGGYMLRTGYRHQFYDLALQKEMENRLAPPMQGLLPINHPAVEYLLWAPFSLLSYRQAYFAFAGFNVLALAACFVLLRGKVNDDRLLLVALLGFPPVMLTLIQSQDSILLLLLACLAYRAQDESVQGLLIGLGVFKFALVIPIAMLYLMWRRWRFVSGFLCSSGVLALASILIVGVQQSLLYIKFVFATEYLPATIMPNLHGIIGALGCGPWLAVISALAALIWFSRARPSMTLALAAGIMCSYHSLPHDLVVLLIGTVVEKRWIGYLASIFGILPGAAFLAASSAFEYVRAPGVLAKPDRDAQATNHFGPSPRLPSLSPAGITIA